MAFSPLSLWTADGDTLEQRTFSSSSPSKPKPGPEPSNRPSSSRLAPPALFQGPPSRNASNLSLHIPGATAAAIGLPAASASTSFLPSSTQQQQQQQLDPLSRTPSRRTPGFVEPQYPSPPSSSISRPKVTGFKRHSTTNSRTKRENENNRADALWAEMQSTLAEVELSAAASADANSSHVFGAGHASALEELRKAQLGLALAWGRSEREEVEKHGVVGEDGEGKERGEQQARSKQRPGSGSGGNDIAGGGGDGEAADGRRKTLEEETENDILLARTRREANDRYFEQVNNAVVDVVKKLDEVAAAMRKVEKESRDIWSDEDDDKEGIGDGSDSAAGGSTTDG